ncbi:hypothetical protein GF391_03660 [Candidatus Uhrbacteria bacterium]|nr:hypothetical protein [Candidatus Uhrbacteria bacterium]
MKVYLVRHGEVENPEGINYGRQPGWHLSKEGKSQISKVSQKIKDKGLKICKIVASPLERAQETAGILSQTLDVAVATDPRLTEWDTGKWIGRTMQDFYENSGYYSDAMVTKGMEPLNDLANRVISAIQDAVTTCSTGDIIICSHREPMAAAIVKLQNLPWPEIHNIDMPTASVWKLVFTDEHFESAQRFL